MAWFLPIWRFRALGFSGFLGPMLFFGIAGQAHFRFGGDLAVRTAELAAPAARLLDLAASRVDFQSPAARQTPF